MLCLGDQDPYLHECISFTCKITLHIDRKIERNFSRVYINGGSRPSGKGGSSRPWDKGVARSPKKFFRLFRPHFGRKIRGAGLSAPPLNPSLYIMVRNSLDSLWSWNFFSLIYLSVWASPLLMAILTLIGKPFIVGLPYLRLKSAITGPHTLMHLFFITFFSWIVGLE